MQCQRLVTRRSLYLTPPAFLGGAGSRQTRPVSPCVCFVLVGLSGCPAASWALGVPRVVLGCPPAFVWCVPVFPVLTYKYCWLSMGHSGCFLLDCLAFLWPSLGSLVWSWSRCLLGLASVGSLPPSWSAPAGLSGCWYHLFRGAHLGLTPHASIPLSKHQLLASIPLQDGSDRISHCKLDYETTTVVFSWYLKWKFCNDIAACIFPRVRRSAFT